MTLQEQLDAVNSRQRRNKGARHGLEQEAAYLAKREADLLKAMAAAGGGVPDPTILSRPAAACWPPVGRAVVLYRYVITLNWEDALGRHIETRRGQMTDVYEDDLESDIQERLYLWACDIMCAPRDRSAVLALVLQPDRTVTPS